ncbi:MAG: DNA-binding response regulator [Bacteroidetes bacterium]|nr:MAG: DNA-binding response regulator [Bacteroidota bacterium]
MSNTSFIIFEKSFLKRLGIISLIKEIKESEILGDYNSSDRFSSIIKNLKPNIVIINKEIYSNINQQVLKNLLLEYSFTLINISEIKEENSEQSDESHIYYDEEKSDILNKIDQAISQIRGHSKKKEKQNNEISQREKAILACVARGLTNKEIAEDLFISTHTVITHRKNIVRKLGIKTVSGLTVYAILNKIIDMTDLQEYR